MSELFILPSIKPKYDKAFLRDLPELNMLRKMIHYLGNKVGVVDFANAQGLVIF